MHWTWCVSNNIQDYDGNTALIEASQNGHAETAKVLLNHGANIHYQNRVRIIINMHTKQLACDDTMA